MIILNKLQFILWNKKKKIDGASGMVKCQSNWNHLNANVNLTEY